MGRIQDFPKEFRNGMKRFVPISGSCAPRFRLPSLDGGIIGLDDLIEDADFLLLVFLRHLW
jgi:hypothetical protein